MASRSLAEQREQAYKLLQVPQNNQQKSPCSFNLSDLKQDKTMYMDRTPNKTSNSPFNVKEISARSTTTFERPANLTFDEIMKTSNSQAVRSKYRESMSMGRLSSLPKTADVSLRTSISSQKQMDFWDAAQPSFSSFVGKNLTFSNEDFKPAEEMAQQLEKDEQDQEMEYAAIPGQYGRETSNWEDSVVRGRMPEMSFGQYCVEKIKSDDIRDLYGNESPKKRSNRVALVELSENNESATEHPSISDSKKLEKFIKSYQSPQTENLVRNFSKGLKQTHQEMASFAERDVENKNPFSNAICKMMEDLNFERIMKKAELERTRAAVEEEKNRTKLDVVPVKDDTMERIDLEEDEENVRNYNMLDVPSRGLKRRPSSVSSDTPKSTLNKCLRSKSPSNMKELQAAAAMLKPKILPDQSVFKVPYTNSSSLKSSSGVSSMNKTNFSSYRANSASSSALPQDSSSILSREYVTAKDNFSLRSPDEKLSLPNYALQRPMNSIASSPSSSIQSRWSPTNANAGRLRRSASQMSNGSEFGDDSLPIKIKNKDNRKLSFESVKVDRHVVKNLSIQNGCDKKLPLRIRVIGTGFSVSPKEDFRMVPMEARTFQVRFSPSIIGPSRGALIFELATNKNCSKTIPMYAYGGHANIVIEGAQKGPFGPQFLTIGCVKDLNSLLEQKLRLKNTGTLPAFASLIFERTKLSDFAILDSLIVEPSQVKINPGQYVNINVRFKATKAEIRKIIAMNKEVTTIGEICVIAGDEPTRLRILQGKDCVEKRFLDYLPKSLPGETETLTSLAKFKEELSREKVSSIMSQIKTHEIALTINRDMDDTQCLSAEISLADDTHMSFETFIDTNYTRVNTNMASDFDRSQQANLEIFESKYFRISPSQITFIRSKDSPGSSKIIDIVSTCDEDLFIEATSSNSKLVSVSLSKGRIRYGEKTEIRVNALSKAFEQYVPINVIIFIGNARVEVPVKFKEL